jgi:glycine dehydrogenase subunit 2
VAVVEKLAKYLPVPRIEKEGDKYILNSDKPDSIGQLLGSLGNFSVIVRAYVYIRSLGLEGLESVSRNAILNANYIKKALEDIYEVPFKNQNMHEFVASGEQFKKEYGVKTLDIAKRLLDYGMHAPTVYFPLIVHEALMIEPTESESRETLDRFIDVMKTIAKEARENPELLHNAPMNTPVRRLDEVKANKEINCRYKK